MILPVSNNYPVVNEEGYMQQELRLWVDEVSDLSILEGVGTPEGSVEAEQKRFYMDTTGTAGAILYIKRDSDIAGDKSKGWILV